jgi:MoaA/NifB/PqqE/SkfB family radical SAM enzyme
MLTVKERAALIKAILSNPQMLRVRPSMVLFLLRYMKRFKIVRAGGNFIIHSHLPPVNSRAYTRFIDEHLLARSPGPSHAQIGITDACPQGCAYCYNKKRSGTAMDTALIMDTVKTLKRMGMFWLGLTGGEPLLNGDILRIVESASDACAVKLFTTGCTLTKERAADLGKAGVFSVSVSLDSFRAEEHDRGRNYKGAFETALRAIDMFKDAGTMHVSVSAVLSREMIRRKETEQFLEFLIGRGVHEAWLSEAKPAVEAFWKDEYVIKEDERRELMHLQDRYNKDGRITVNYLGHFESGEYFGCNAGHRMVYIDAFGEVSPCVFIPMSFGTVKERRIEDIWTEMRARFPSEDACFINKNYASLRRHYRGRMPIDRGDSLKIMDEVQFGPLARFARLHDRRAG